MSKYRLSEIKKTIVAAVPFALATLKVVSDALGDGVVTTQEWVTAVIAGLATVGVFAVRNTPAKGQVAKPDVSEADTYDGRHSAGPAGV